MDDIQNAVNRMVDDMSASIAWHNQLEKADDVKEVLKDIPNYEGLYQVSSEGCIWSVPRKDSIGRQIGGRYLKQSIDTSGYLRVNLHKDGKAKPWTAHQLVAITFLNHVPNGYTIVVDHIDHDPLNNKLSNLQLITQRENTVRGKKTKGGSSEYVGVTWNKRGKKWQAQITHNGKLEYLGVRAFEYDAYVLYQNRLKEINNDK